MLYSKTKKQEITDKKKSKRFNFKFLLDRFNFKFEKNDNKKRNN